MNIRLQIMSKDLARQYFKHFQLDPILFMYDSKYQPYVYSDEKSDATIERYRQLGRVHLAVMLDDEPIGEIVLKHINHGKRHCTLGISMRSDEYKNRGYGTKTEILALEYAFNKLGMETVFAESILKNARSQHVLKKVGFIEASRDEAFIYYRCDKAAWYQPDYDMLLESAI